MDYINGLNLWFKVEYSQWEAQMKSREKVERKSGMYSCVPLPVGLRLALSLFDRRSPLLLMQNALHDSYTLFSF